MRKNKLLQWVILLLILVVGGYAIVSGVITKDSKEQAKVSYVPPDFKLEALNGEIIKRNDYQGKPLVINFWGSFCEPCVRETPLLSRMAEAYKAKGISFIGINLDEPKVVVKSFIRNTPVVYPILFDPEGKTRDLYQVVSYPTTFFIGADGKIKSIYVGELVEDTIRTELSKILE